MGILKIGRRAEIFLTLAAISLLLSQVVSYQIDSSRNALEEKLISAIDTQVKVSDVRAAMNEHLLRYLVGINPKINETAKELSSEVNQEFSQQDVIKFYFNTTDEMNVYFMEVYALNSMRPQWENQSTEALLITFQIENQKMSLLEIGYVITIISAFIFLILGLYYNREVYKASK
ncbi:MAG: hypothetical protein NTW30_04100 [Candidatus Aenigmarchaeota archaeon]|nr:hypothetical protein [Candidatus Aenigmarchaeota archaeon]